MADHDHCPLENDPLSVARERIDKLLAASSRYNNPVNVTALNQTRSIPLDRDSHEGKHSEVRLDGKSEADNREGKSEEDFIAGSNYIVFQEVKDTSSVDDKSKRYLRPPARKRSMHYVPQRVTSMGVGYLGVRWPSRDHIAIKSAKKVEQRQRTRELNAVRRITEKTLRSKQHIETNKAIECEKRQEIRRYQLEENQRLERLSKLAEKERLLAEASASRQRERLLELKSKKARVAQLKRTEVTCQKNKVRLKLKKFKVVKDLKPREKVKSSLDVESMASTITTKATAAALMEVHTTSIARGSDEETHDEEHIGDEAEELFQSIRQTTVAAEKQLQQRQSGHSSTPQRVGNQLMKKSAYARVKARLKEMDALLGRLREQQQQSTKVAKKVTRKMKRGRPAPTWMKPTVSSSMNALPPKPRPPDIDQKTESADTRSQQSRERFEQYYKRYQGNGVDLVLEAQDEDQLLDEAGSLLASGLLHPTAPCVGYTWEALSHTMGFTESSFNKVKTLSHDPDLALKVNSLRDALSRHFRPSMHHHEALRPTFSMRHDVLSPSNTSNAYSLSQPTATSAWEELAAIANTDAGSVKSHTTAS